MKAGASAGASEEITGSKNSTIVICQRWAILGKELIGRLSSDMTSSRPDPPPPNFNELDGPSLTSSNIPFSP